MWARRSEARLYLDMKCGSVQKVWTNNSKKREET